MLYMCSLCSCIVAEHTYLHLSACSYRMQCVFRLSTDGAVNVHSSSLCYWKSNLNKRIFAMYGTKVLARA